MDDPKDESTMTFNDLLIRTGGTGLFQILNFLILGICVIFTAETIYITFIAGVPEHWCKVEELKALPFEIQKNVAIPADDTAHITSTSSFSKCQMFDLPYSNYSMEDFLNWNRTEMAEGNKPIACSSGWVYDRSIFANTVVDEWDLVCDREWMVPMLATAFTAGMLFGSVISGTLADRFGRCPVLVIAMVVRCAASIASAYVQDYSAMMALRFVIGFGNTATYLPAFVLVMEVAVNLGRAIFGTGIAVIFSIGYMLIPCVAFAIRDWRYLSIVQGSGSILGFIVWWILPESPRWLLLQRRYKEADKVIRFIAKVNNRPLPEDFDISTVSVDEENKKDLPRRNILDLFRHKRTRQWTLIIYLHWFTDSLVYYAMSLNAGNLAGDLFLNTFLLGLVEIPANILMAFTIQWRCLGRRLSASLSLLLAGVVSMICIPLLVTNASPLAVTSLSILGKGAATMAFSCAYVYTGEIFPTEVRSVAIGSASTIARISGMAAPFVGGILGNAWEGLPYLVYGVFGIVSGSLALYLPETLGRPMYDTIEEAENAGRPAQLVGLGPGKQGSDSSSTRNQAPSSVIHRRYPLAFDNEAYTPETSRL